MTGGGDPLPAVEAFFADVPLGLDVHRAVLAALAPVGTPSVRVTRAQVAYRRRAGFAWTWLPERWLRNAAGIVVLSISLPVRDPSPRWKEVVQPRRERWMHHLEVRDASEVDPEVAAWLVAGWDAAG